MATIDAQRTMTMDRDAPLRFLRTAFHPDDHIAVLLKSHETGGSTQRVGPVSLIAYPRFQAWLRAQSARQFSVFVSVNTIRPQRRARTREAIGAIRHVFLDVDRDAQQVLAGLAARSDLPAPSYVLQSSPHRVHVFWRVAGFGRDDVEALQKRLATEAGADRAATSCSQLTRLVGFPNHKYRPAPLVGIDYGAADRVFTPADFPAEAAHVKHDGLPAASLGLFDVDRLERARRYLAAMPPAVMGEHGDVQTFRACCRLVRGFALSDADALAVLRDWNANCQPPWSETELRQKLTSARRYGREPIGGLLVRGSKGRGATSCALSDSRKIAHR